jgi:hypothetical protein
MSVSVLDLHTRGLCPGRGRRGRPAPRIAQHVRLPVCVHVCVRVRVRVCTRGATPEGASYAGIPPSGSNNPVVPAGQTFNQVCVPLTAGGPGVYRTAGYR